LYNHNTFVINFRVKIIERLLLETKIMFIDKVTWENMDEKQLFYQKIGFNIDLPPRYNSVIFIMSFDNEKLSAYWLPELNIVSKFMSEKIILNYMNVVFV